MSDPTKVTNQPSLTTSSGRVWLIVGGLFAAIALAVLIPMLTLGSPGVALFGIVAVSGLYLAMIVARLVTPRGRLRLGLMAAFMILMALVSLACILVVFVNEWNAARA
ncbi:MAG TPA: hypothetical protein DCP11_15085 [Microbacteriaceae bacterium]|jgi:hypothetical protein|nr:hypothetical protein [Microbacteriaceae bacterium]